MNVLVLFLVIFGILNASMGLGALLSVLRGENRQYFPVVIFLPSGLLMIITAGILYVRF